MGGGQTASSLLLSRSLNRGLIAPPRPVDKSRKVAAQVGGEVENRLDAAESGPSLPRTK